MFNGYVVSDVIDTQHTRCVSVVMDSNANANANASLSASTEFFLGNAPKPYMRTLCLAAAFVEADAVLAIVSNIQQ